MAKTLREIIIEYANTRGGGLPVTPEEMCNALTLWVQEQFSDEHIRELFPDFVSSNTIYVAYNPQTKNYTIELKYNSTESVFFGATTNGLIANVKEEWIKEKFFNAIDLSELFEGSETVVVDVNDTNDKIEIHLDDEVVSKLERAILTPNSIEPEKRVPYIHPNGSVRYADIDYTYLRYIVFEANDANTGDFKYAVGIHYPCKENKAVNSIDELLGELAELPTHESLIMVNGYVLDENSDFYSVIAIETSGDGNVRVYYGPSNYIDELLEFTISIASDSLIEIINA